jgi:hypothetical protein
VEAIEREDGFGEEPASKDAPTPPSKRRLTRNQVIGYFTVKKDPSANEKFWTEALGHCPKWLEPARISRGGKGVPGLWDPLGVALALLDSKAKHMIRNELNKVIRENFPELLEQWREAAE